MKPESIAKLSNEPGLSREHLAEIKAKQEEERRKFKPGNPPMTWESLGLDLDRFLGTEPPPPEWIFSDLLRAGTVGALVSTGGAGKSRLLLHMMLSLATGTPFGPFTPAGPQRVLYLSGEDPAEILHERIYAIARGMGLVGEGNLAAIHGRLLRENFRAVPMVGMDRVLIGRDKSGNPTTTQAYDWLSESLAGMGKVDLVVIDPLSRFSALEENDNNAATAFIACLEALAKNHGAAVLFSHHSSKAVVKDGDPSQDKGRGASALFDGARMMLALGSVDGETLGLPDEGGQGFIVVHQVKGNYSKLWGKPYYFSKGEGLTLTPVDPQEGIRGRQVEELVSLLPAEGLSGRAILKSRAGKEVRDGMKDAFPKLAIRKELALILTAGVEYGKLAMVDTEERGRNGIPVQLYRVPSSADTQRTNAVSAENKQETLFQETASEANPHSGHSGHSDKHKPDTADTQRTKKVSAENEDHKPIPTADTKQRTNAVSADTFVRCQPASSDVLKGKKPQRTKPTPTGKK